MQLRSIRFFCPRNCIYKFILIMPAATVPCNKESPKTSISRAPERYETNGRSKRVCCYSVLGQSLGYKMTRGFQFIELCLEKLLSVWWAILNAAKGCRKRKR